MKQKPAPHQNPYGHGGLGHRMPAGTGMSQAQLERAEVRAHKTGTCHVACSVCAYEALRAARPLRPPPGRPEVVPATAAAIALAADRRAGLVGEWGF